MKLLMLSFYQLFCKVINKIYYTDGIQRVVYNVDKKILLSKGISLGSNSIVLGCNFSNSAKGDKFFIGDNTTCTGVNFLGHDASPTLFISELVLKNEPYLRGARCSYRKAIKIGRQCFIGYNTIILPGVTICDKCIVAAGSVVTKSIIESGVYAGNPARKVSELDDFIIKYRNLLIQYPEYF